MDSTSAGFRLRWTEPADASDFGGRLDDLYLAAQQVHTISSQSKKFSSTEPSESADEDERPVLRFDDVGQVFDL